MADNTETNVKIGASTEGLQAGMAGAEATVDKTASSIQASMQRMSSEVSGSIKGMQSQIKSQFSMIGDTVHKVTGAILAVSAVVAGGKAFKEVIGETVKWTGEAVKLSKALGITVQEASILNVALDDTFNSMDTMLAGANMVTKTLKGNEDAFGKLGVATRDANGHYRATGDIMNDVNAKLNTLKEGTDRNVAGMMIYGRQWNETKGLLRLNAEAMEDAKQRAAELHLIVGPEGVKQAKAYKSAMKDIEDVSQSLKVQIGNAVLPVFIQLGAWFNSIGPSAIEIFKGALQGVITFAQGLALGTTIAFELIKAGLQQLVTIAMTTASVLMKVMKGDFAGAWEEAKAGLVDFGKSADTAFSNIEKASISTADSLAKMWGLKPTENKPTKEAPDGRVDPDLMGKGKKEKDPVAEWRSELEQRKVAEENFFKDSKNADLEFWQSKLKLTENGSKEQRSVLHEMFQLKSGIAHDELAVELQAMKDQSEAALQGSQERINIAKEEADLIKSKYGAQSREYAAMLREIDAKQREFEADQRKRKEMVINTEKELQMISIGMERDKIEFLKDMESISEGEAIERKKQLAENEYSVEMNSLQQKLNLQRKGSIEEFQVMEEIERAQASHNQRMQQYSFQSALATRKAWEPVFSSITSAFSSAIQGMITGGLTFQKAMRQMGLAVLNTFIGMIVQMAARWLMNQIFMTTVSTAQAAQRLATENSLRATGLASTISMNVATAMSEAAVAAASAMASVAAIPYVGWAMAPGIGASTYAQGMGYAVMASAAGGYDVPEDQMAMIHKKEMVLPAELSNKIRNMADPGPGGSRSDGGNTFIINALDAKSFKRFAKENGGALAHSIRNQARNFNGAFA